MGSKEQKLPKQEDKQGLSRTPPPVNNQCENEHPHAQSSQVPTSLAAPSSYPSRNAPPFHPRFACLPPTVYAQPFLLHGRSVMSGRVCVLCVLPHCLCASNYCSYGHQVCHLPRHVTSFVDGFGRTWTCQPEHPGGNEVLVDGNSEVRECFCGQFERTNHIRQSNAFAVLGRQQSHNESVDYQSVCEQMLDDDDEETFERNRSASHSSAIALGDYRQCLYANNSLNEFQPVLSYFNDDNLASNNVGTNATGRRNDNASMTCRRRRSSNESTLRRGNLQSMQAAETGPDEELHAEILRTTGMADWRDSLQTSRNYIPPDRDGVQGQPAAPRRLMNFQAQHGHINWEVLPTHVNARRANGGGELHGAEFHPPSQYGYNVSALSEAQQDWQHLDDITFRRPRSYNTVQTLTRFYRDPRIAEELIRLQNSEASPSEFNVNETREESRGDEGRTEVTEQQPRENEVEYQRNEHRGDSRENCRHLGQQHTTNHQVNCDVEERSEESLPGNASQF